MKLLTSIASAIVLIAAVPVHAETIHIRVLKAHNGKPLVNEKVNVHVEGDKDDGTYTTDANGTFALDLDSSKVIFPSTEWWITCRKVNTTKPRLFSVQTIHDDGVVDENTCGKARSEPIRGTLTIFARRATLFENMAR